MCTSILLASLASGDEISGKIDGIVDGDTITVLDEAKDKSYEIKSAKVKPITRPATTTIAIRDDEQLLKRAKLMAKKAATKAAPKKAPAKKAAVVAKKDRYTIQHVTIQELQPGKFKITPGKFAGLVWDIHPRGATTIEEAKKSFLRSISKTQSSWLSQEDIDVFLKYVEANGFRVAMPSPEWKKNFARRFQRYLAKQGFKLEQIEEQPYFQDLSARGWLRRLYKNGIHTETKFPAAVHIPELCKILGIRETDEF